MKTTNPKLSIIVLNYDGLDQTVECINSLKRLNTKNVNCEIIVVDNNSQDGSAEVLAKLTDIKFIQNYENYGFAKGMNVGVASALLKGAQYIMILNNDTIVDENLAKNLLKNINNYDIISPKIYFAANYEFHKQRYKKDELGKVIWYAGGKIDWNNVIGIHTGVDEVDTGQFDKKREIDFATGACMLIKSEVFQKIGKLDEKYFLYLEDMDFCVRAKNAGFKILYEPSGLLWHKNAQSAGGSGSRTQDYYFTRNRLLFAVKYASIRSKIALIKQILKQINDPIKRRALIDFFFLRFGKGNIS